MAELILFQFDPRPSSLAGLDPRLKLGVLAAAGAGSFFLNPAGLLFLGTATLLLFPLGKASLRIALKNGLVLWFILALLFLSRLFGSPGEPLFEPPPAWPVATVEGFRAGIFEAGRILLLVLLGHLFLACTPFSDLRRTLKSLLSFLPGERGAETAFLLGLAAGMVPRLLLAAWEIREALRLRNFSFLRHPFRGVLLFGRAFTRKALREALAAAEALEARNYHMGKKEKPFDSGRRDLAALLAAAAALTSALLLSA